MTDDAHRIAKAARRERRRQERGSPCPECRRNGWDPRAACPGCGFYSARRAANAAEIDRHSS